MREANDEALAKKVFLDALERESGERTSFLDATCADDDLLRRRVDDLLAAYGRSAGLDALADSLGEGAHPEPAPSTLGDYEITEELGRGGAGIVYRARQRSLGRQVALKVLLAGSAASAEDVARFRREAEAAAALDHAGIVPIYEVGEAEGRPFFSMKWVDGPGLDEVIGDFQGDPERAARVVAGAARAVHHAHLRGVLHRDLKPSNILLDGDGTPHVADFGIARPIGDTRVTRTGHVTGTPAYMSPEQGRGDRDVTVATDVWSLGCVLYELLSGAPPFEGQSLVDVLRRVQDDEPARLAAVPRDLDTVVGACLAKDPARRYPSAAALADDLERWLAKEPISARATTRFERLQLLYRRNPVSVALAVVVVFLLLVLSIVGGLGTVFLREKLLETEAANRRAEDRLRTSLLANARSARRGREMGRREAGLDLLRQAATIRAGPDVRDEAITTLTLLDLESSGAIELPPDLKGVIGLDGETRSFVHTREDNSVEIRDLEGHLRSRLPAAEAGLREGLFTHGGDRLWLRRFRLGSPVDTILEVWDIGGGEPRLIDEREVATRDFTVSDDGTLVALACHEADTIEVIDTDSLAVLHAFPVEHDEGSVAFRADGTALAVATGASGAVEVLSLPDGRSLARLALPGHARSIDWAPDSDLLIVGSYDQNAYVWETSGWTRTAVLRGHEAEVMDARMLPNGRALTWSWDGTARVWDAVSGVELLRAPHTLVGIVEGGRGAIFQGDRHVLPTRLVGDDVLLVRRAHEGKAPTEVAMSRDGRYLASCGDAGWILWNARDLTPVARLESQSVRSVFFDPSGERVITSGLDGLRAWSLPPPGESVPEVLLEGACDRAAGSPDGEWLAVVRDRKAVLLDRSRGERVLGEFYGLDRIAFSPDGAFVAVGTWGGSGLRVWETASGELAAHLLPESTAAMATFSPDGTRMVVSTYEGIRIHEVGGWTLEREFSHEGPWTPPVPAAFDPAGEVLAAAIARGRVRLYGVDGWSTLADLEPAEPRALFHMGFIDGGRRLAIASPSRRLLVWDLGALRAALDRDGLTGESPPPWVAAGPSD